MTDVFEKMLARVGKSSDDVPTWSRVGKLLRKRGVKDTPELQRIIDIPRREWRAVEPWLVEQMTTWLRRSTGQMDLRPIQAAALSEFHDFDGLFAPIRVGGGKTLISFLAGRVVAARRPLLIIPAKLRGKTRREMEVLARHWVFPRPELVSYEKLGRASNADFLNDLRPDCIVADECHRLKTSSAAVTSRVRRYLTENEDVRFLCMSGTILSTSLEDFEHLLAWSLPETLFPLPKNYPEFTAWADCVDVKPTSAARMAPGALVRLYNEEEAEQAVFDPLGATRRSLRRRIVETPGVVATNDRVLGTSLSITAKVFKYQDAGVIEEPLKHLRDFWETPDGWDVTEAVQIWKHANELSNGFYYRWDPRPPEEWTEARRNFNRQVRHILRHNQRNLDSMVQVVNAIDKGHYDSEPLEKWREVRDSFKVNVVPVWFSDEMVEKILLWMERHTGIVWCQTRALALRLQERGADVYGSEGLNKDGRYIEDAPDGQSIVASIAANSEGRNLQYKWAENLLTEIPSSGKEWEQLLGRTHRDGQPEDEVNVELWLGSIEQWACFQNALLKSKFIQDTMGQEQKLLYADLSGAVDTESVAHLKGPLWNK